VLAIGHRPQFPDALGHAQDVGPSIWAWLAVPGAGVLVGLACGALIGAVCGGAAPVNLADVWSIARKPTDALGALLGPKDLVKLGAALRDRPFAVYALDRDAGLAGKGAPERSNTIIEARRGTAEAGIERAARWRGRRANRLPDRNGDRARSVGRGLRLAWRRHQRRAADASCEQRRADRHAEQRPARKP